MRIMALDVGDKTIGVAVTDQMGWSAQGIDTIKRAGLKSDIIKIEKYISEYNVQILVIGVPYRGNGEVGIQAGKVLRFMDALEKELFTKHPDIKIDTWDESMTTAEAHEVLASARVTSKKRKKVVDKLAAVFILQSYLRGKGVDIDEDSKRHG